LRARPEVSPLVVLRIVDWGVFGGGLSGFAEEGEDDLELFGGEEFALGRIGGFGEFGHQGGVGVDFAGEELSCALLAAVGEIGYGKVLLELVHNTEIID